MAGNVLHEDTIEKILKKLRFEIALGAKSNSPLNGANNAAALQSNGSMPPIRQESPVKSSGASGSAVWRALENFNGMLRKNKLYNLLYSGILGLIRKNNRAPHSLDALLAYEDEEFIIQAYRILLERDPDPVGSNEYIRHLRNGTKTKIDILAGIRFYTDEGMEHSINIRGLRRRFVMNKVLHLPIVGYCARVIIIVLKLPKLNRTLDLLRTQTATSSIHFKKAFNESAAHQELKFKILGEEIINLKEVLSSHREEKQLLQDEIATLNKELSEIRSDIMDQKREMLDQQRRHMRLLEEMDSILSNPSAPGELSAIPKGKKQLDDNLYASFEDRFRGSRDDIKNRARVYLPYVEMHVKNRAAEAIIDVGCGRGEWLELLKENDFTPTGIDSNTMMIRECQSRNLPAVEIDAIEYLKRREKNSVSVLTCLHLVEHLQFETIIMLLDACLSVLMPGGMIIIETPNPENILVGSCHFYTDPTHRNPIPPGTLQFLAEKRGFRDIEIIRLHPPDAPDQMDGIPESLSRIFNNGQDYSLIAYK